MTFLLVGNSAESLKKLAACLQGLFPGDDIHTETDPLMAVKFALAQRVDVVLAEGRMKRMDGPQLGELITQTNPAARVFLMTEGQDASAGPFGLLLKPVTEASLRAALQPLSPHGAPGSQPA